MAAPKGNNFAGSRKGIKNKKTQQWEDFCEYSLGGGLEKFRAELDKLNGKEYVQAYLTLLEYHKPKLARSEVNLEGNLNIQDISQTKFCIKPKGK